MSAFPCKLGSSTVVPEPRERKARKVRFAPSCHTSTGLFSLFSRILRRCPQARNMRAGRSLLPLARRWRSRQPKGWVGVGMRLAQGVRDGGPQDKSRTSRLQDRLRSLGLAGAGRGLRSRTISFVPISGRARSQTSPQRSVSMVHILEDLFADAQPHSFLMWLSSWFPCPLCRQRTLTYVRSHGGIVCTSAECQKRTEKWARMMEMCSKGS